MPRELAQVSFLVASWMDNLKLLGLVYSAEVVALVGIPEDLPDNVVEVVILRLAWL